MRANAPIPGVGYACVKREVDADLREDEERVRAVCLVGNVRSTPASCSTKQAIACAGRVARYGF